MACQAGTGQDNPGSAVDRLAAFRVEFYRCLWRRADVPLACGRIDFGRLRWVLAALPLPRGSGRQLKVAIDVTPWPRPDAECSPDRLHCHRPCRCDGIRQTIPGWPYSVVAALENGRSSWTAPLDIRRIDPDDDLTEVTAAQIRDLLARLVTAGQLLPEDPPLLVVMDSGYDIVRFDLAAGRSAGIADRTAAQQPGDVHPRARPAPRRQTRPPTPPR
jgi:hypothetical protein